MIRRMRVACAGLVVSVVALGNAAYAEASNSAQPDPEPASETVWLCRPGLAQNPCEGDLTATAIEPNGQQKTERASPAKNPPVDCFYVYPTVSAQSTVNANLNIDPELIAVAETQAARFSQVCRVYAPVYPQLTVVSIGGGANPEARATAYGGVLSAWKEYLAKYNKGRGVVFIGHSQGTGMLTQLLKAEVDPNPKLRRRTVSALLLGGNVTVAAGKNIGGDFQHLPACEKSSQTGCVVAYSMFGEQPPPNALFGRPSRSVSAASGQDPATLEVLCVNPASFKGSGPLRPYLRTSRFPGPIGAVSGEPPSASTPWVEYPKLFAADCRRANGFTWLQVDNVGGANAGSPQSSLLPPSWGLHLGDVNLALGNLVDLARKQSAAYRR